MKYFRHTAIYELLFLFDKEAIIMRIKNGNKYLEFLVLNYQFPNFSRALNNDIFDVNWLTIQVKYSNDSLKEYVYTDSCLLTFELKEIIEEFTKVANGISKEYKSDFIEPYLNIELENKKGEYVVEISFVTSTCSDEWEEIGVKSSLNQKELLQFIDYMNSELSKFPER